MYNLTRHNLHYHLLLSVFTMPMQTYHYSRLNTPYLKKLQNCFCQNFVTFPPILIIFGSKMTKRLKLCEVHSFPTSSNSHHNTTVLNADVPYWYTTVKLLVLDCSHLHHQFDRGRHVILFLGNSYIFDKYSLRPFVYQKEGRRRKPTAWTGHRSIVSLSGPLSALGCPISSVTTTLLWSNLAMAASNPSPRRVGCGRWSVQLFCIVRPHNRLTDARGMIDRSSPHFTHSMRPD